MPTQKLNNTQPLQAEGVRRTFQPRTHLIVDHAGHESRLVNAAVQQAINDYLHGKEVSPLKIALPLLKFAPLPEQKQQFSI